jgi:hypothetical protein
MFQLFNSVKSKFYTQQSNYWLNILKMYISTKAKPVTQPLLKKIILKKLVNKQLVTPTRFTKSLIGQ